MRNVIPSINPEKETGKITGFIKSILKKTGFKNVVIGVSGGIDSATSLFLLANSMDKKNIYPVHLPFTQNKSSKLKQIISNLHIPLQNFSTISIKSSTDNLAKILNLLTTNYQLLSTRIRLGNIMARIRMIILYDLAKHHNALVCGTENKSEHLLGYYTRFGDAASDLEPISHLYKTQVYELAKYLKIPEEVIRAKPTAGLWKGQTDEGQFGFTYQEADQVLHLYFDKKTPIKVIEKQGFKNADKIINFALKNSFKHQVPYNL